MDFVFHRCPRTSSKRHRQRWAHPPSLHSHVKAVVPTLGSLLVPCPHLSYCPRRRRRLVNTQAAPCLHAARKLPVALGSRGENTPSQRPTRRRVLWTHRAARPASAALSSLASATHARPLGAPNPRGALPGGPRHWRHPRLGHRPPPEVLVVASRPALVSAPSLLS